MRGIDVTGARRIALNWQQLWGKTGQITALRTVGDYGFTTSEGTKKELCISSFSYDLVLRYCFFKTFLLLLQVSSPGTVPGSRKNRANMQASHTGSQERSAR